jgi:RNA polymerase sigma factor (sigma-70 family)
MQTRGAVRGDYLVTLFGDGAIANLSDSQLLDRFLARRDEAAELAFAALVQRHGPMVVRVCRGVLASPHDADDAFQATFLVLARKAGAIGKRGSLASFLHGVALRAAREIRAAAIRRQRHEALAAARSPEREEPGELCQVVHDELARLPEHYRDPIVLCELEGLPCEEAAARLGCPVGTIKSRLARGRERLRARLVRRGVTRELTFGATVALPGSLAETTARGARPFARGTTSAAIAERVVRAMLVARVAWSSAALVLLGGVLLIGFCITTGQSPAAPAQPRLAPAPAGQKRAAAQPLPADAENDDLTGMLTGPSRDEIVALIKKIGRDEPTPELVDQITSYFRPREKEGSGRFRHLSRLATDPKFVGEIDSLARELTHKPATTRILLTQAMAHHAGREDALHREELRTELARWATPGKTLHGRVLDDQENPVAGVEVSTWGALARTDASGEFRLHLDRPRQRVPAKNVEAIFLAARGYALSESIVAFDEVDEANVRSFRLSQPVACTGRVVDPDGRPVADAELNLWIARDALVRDGTLDYRVGGNAEILKARTDSDGRYAFRGVPAIPPGPPEVRRRNGVFSLTVVHPRFEITEYHFKQNEQPPLRLDVTVRPGCTVAGTVVDEAGRPVTGAEVHLSSNEKANQNFRPEDVTDRDGRFRFDQLPPGRWQIDVEPEEHAMALAEATASRDAPVDLKITVPTGGYLTGKVIGPDGKPSANSVIGWLQRLDSNGKPVDAPGLERITHTAPDGSFRLGPVPEGRYRILALIGDPRSEAYGVSETGQNDLVIRHEPAAK